MGTFGFGLLLIRVTFGAGLAAHGAQKMFGWFGGGGLRNTARFFESIGFRPGAPFVAAAASAEIVGGLFLATGFGGPFAAMLIAADLLVAIAVVHAPNGFFEDENGWEFPALYIALAVTYAFVGYGPFSLDAQFKLVPVLDQPIVIWCALGIGLAAALANLFLRRPVSRSS